MGWAPSAPQLLPSLCAYAAPCSFMALLSLHCFNILVKHFFHTCLIKVIFSIHAVLVSWLHYWTSHSITDSFSICILYVSTNCTYMHMVRTYMYVCKMFTHSYVSYYRSSVLSAINQNLCSTSLLAALLDADLHHFKGCVFIGGVFIRAKT